MKEIYGQPLVSVIVVTYNSSKYVIETLESAKSQTYTNIELIISDDCSTDSTVKICTEWLSLNGDYFVSSRIITSSTNTGIPSNLNRGINVVAGDWIKCIAGDDLLLPECIEKNVGYINNHDEIFFLFSKIVPLNSGSLNSRVNNSFLDFNFFNLSEKKQYDFLIKHVNCVPAATAFLNKSILISLGLFDERIKLIEDYPMWIKATQNDYKLYFFEEETVCYRFHDDSISQSKLSIEFYKSQYLVLKYYIFTPLFTSNPFLAIDKWIIIRGRSRKYFLQKKIFILLRMLSPYFYYKVCAKVLYKYIK